MLQWRTALLRDDRSSDESERRRRSTLLHAPTEEDR